MKVVIDIDDNLYTRLFDNGDIDAVDMLKACVSIRKGTLLPKNHGRLIDADKVKENMMYAMCGTGYQTKAMNVLNEYYTPTIIEKESEEE